MPARRVVSNFAEVISGGRITIDKNDRDFLGLKVGDMIKYSIVKVDVDEVPLSDKELFELSLHRGKSRGKRSKSK